MSDIFISYRRQDSAGFTHTLGKKLAERFGEDSIFRDLEDIEAGNDFVVEIEEAVSSCKVLIAIIGPHWSNIKNKQGTRRLENPHDFVRLEIESALKREIPVLPVTVNGAAWPPAEILPESLQVLLRHQAHDLSDKQGRWDYDVDQLIKRLDKIDGVTAITPSAIPDKPVVQKSTFKPKLMLGLGAVIIAVLGSTIFLPDPDQEGELIKEKVDVNDPDVKIRMAKEQSEPVSVAVISEPVVKPSEEKVAQSKIEIQQPAPEVAAIAKPPIEKVIPQQTEVKTVDRTSKEYYSASKFIDISGNWRDRWGVIHYIEMTDKTHFVAMSEEGVAEGVINGKDIEITVAGGGYGKYRLSNIGNHISGTYYESADAKGEDVVLMRVKN